MAFVNDSGRSLCPAVPSVMAVVVFASFCLASDVRAATYTFSGTNGAFGYTNGTGWSPGAPVGGFTNSLIFGNGASLAAGANVTVTNNLGFTRFHSITVNYVGPGSGAAPTFTLGGQGVTLSSSNGSNPFILISNTGTVRPDTTISQWMTFDANTTITTVSDLTLAGRFFTNANNAAVTKNGAGVLRIVGDNTANGYTGNWTVAAGALHIGNAGSGNLGSGTITLTNDAIYVQRTTGNQSVDNVISGTTSQFVTFHLGSNNVVTLNKQSDYTSGFTYLQPLLGAGTGELRLGTNNAMSGNTVVEMQNAAGYTLTLNLNNYNQTLKHLQSTAGATAANTKVSLGSGTLTVGDASNRTFGGEISGSGGVVKTGSGSWTLTAANTYSGTTTLSGGTIRVGNDSALGTGGFTITGGTFASDGGAARTITNAVTMGGNVQFGDATGTGALTLSNINLGTTTRTLTVSNSATVAGTITNTGGLTKAGNGTLTLAASNTYSGGTTISAGTLLLTNAGSVAGNITNNAALAINRSDSSTLGNIVSGSGSLTKAGAGTLTLTGLNTYTGGTLLNGGWLVAGHTNAFGTGSITVGSGTTLSLTNFNIANLIVNNGGTILSTGTLDDVIATNGTTDIGGNNSTIEQIGGTAVVNVTGSSVMVSNTTGGTLNADGSSVQVASVSGGTVNLGGSSAVVTAASGGTVNANASGATLGTVSGTAAVNVAGANARVATLSGGSVSANASGLVVTNFNGGNIAVSNGVTVGLRGGSSSGVISGQGGIAKQGADTLTLSGVNTLSGVTTVEQGKLVVNGSLNNSAVTVQSGAILGGSGSIGTLTLNGILAPGNSAGQTDVGTTAWNQGGSYDWEIFNLADAPGSSWDWLNVTNGSLNLSGITAPGGFTINLITLTTNNSTPGPLDGFNAATNYSNWLIVSAPTITNFSANLFTLNTNSFVGATGIFAIEQRAYGGGQGLFLTYTGGGEPIPEPGTWAAGALLLGAAAYIRWRRRYRQSTGAR